MFIELAIMFLKSNTSAYYPIKNALNQRTQMIYSKYFRQKTYQNMRLT